MPVSATFAGTDAEGQPRTGNALRWALVVLGLLPALPLIILPRYGYVLPAYQLFIIVIGWNVFAFAFLWLVRRNHGIRFPSPREIRLLHDDRYASGGRADYPQGFLHGRGCLRLVVTENELWVTAWFPITCLIELGGTECRIALDDLIQAVRKPGLLRSADVFKIAFQAKDRTVRLSLQPRDPGAFMAALKQNPDLANSGKLVDKTKNP